MTRTSFQTNRRASTLGILLPLLLVACAILHTTQVALADTAPEAASELSSSPPAGPDRVSPQALMDSPVREEGSVWAEYFKAGDLDGLMSLYIDDAVVALHGQPALFGKAAVREYFSSRIGKSDSEIELDYELIEIHGDIAYIISKYWLRAVDKASGEVFRDAGRSMLVYQKHNGRWLIAADLDQSTPDVGWPSPAGME